jgi:hypothetical protein
VGVDGAADLAGELSDLLDEWLERGDEPEHGRATGVCFELADDGDGCQAQPREQVRGGSPAAVGVAGEERLQALFAEAARVGRAGVALAEGEPDRAVDVGEDAPSAGPERVELGAQPVGQRDARRDEILAGAHERAQGDGLVARGRQGGESVAVGARELAQHEAVEGVGLAGGGAEAVARGLDLVGVNRQHGDPGGQQPTHEQSIRTLDRDQLDGVRAEQRQKRLDAVLVMAEAPLRKRGPVGIADTHVVPFVGPVDAADCAHASSSSLEVISRKADREVPWRVLIDRPSAGRRRVAALGASHRRKGQVSPWPSQRQASRALFRRWSALCTAQA